MNLFGRTLALCAFAAGATLALGDIFFLPHRTPLVHQLVPFGFPAVEGPLGGAWGYGKIIGEHRFIARLDGAREPLGLLQTDADGRGASWWGNFSPRQRVLFTDGPWMGATWVFLAEPATGPVRVAVSGFGLRIQTQDHGPFLAEIRALNKDTEVWSPWFRVEGLSDRDADGAARFIGVGSTARNIAAVQVRAISQQQVVWGYFGMGSPSVAIEPLSMPD